MRPRCVIGVVCSLRMFEIAVISKGRISVGRMKTLAELDAETGRLSPEPGVAGEPKQEFDQKLNVNHWKYHRRLDPSWDNAAWASSMVDTEVRELTHSVFCRCDQNTCSRNKESPAPLSPASLR